MVRSCALAEAFTDGIAAALFDELSPCCDIVTGLGEAVLTLQGVIAPAELCDSVVAMRPARSSCQ